MGDLHKMRGFQILSVQNQHAGKMQKTSDSLQQTAAVATGYYKFLPSQRLNKVDTTL